MPVVPAVTAIWAGISAIAGTTVGGYLIGTAVSYGIGYVAQKLGGDKRDRNADAFDAGIKTNRISNVAPIPVLYGEREVGGTEYRAVSGTDNKYLWRVLVLSEGEIDSVQNVYLNGRDVDTDEDYAPYVDWWFHSGTNGQAADVNMVSAIEDWSEDHRGYGVAYIVVRMEYDPEVFSGGLPALTCLARGRKIYDPRTSQTVWSDNPALCIRDYLTNTRYGRGIDASALDDSTFIDAANHCDELVTVKDSNNADVQQKRYTCNGVVNPDDTSLDIIQSLCTSCRAVVVPPGEKYKLRIDRAEAAVFAFTEDNILGEWNITGIGSRTMLNRVNARFFDAGNEWEETIQVVSSDTFREYDNGRVYEAEISLPFTDQVQRADILAQHHLKQARQGWRVTFAAPLEALQVEVMDVVTITHSTPEWDEKPFRVHGLELRDDDTMVVTLQEYDSSVYTFDLHTPPAYPDTGLPDPFSTPPPAGLVLASGSEHLLRATDGTIISRIYATWGAPTNPFVVAYEVGYKLSSTTGWTHARTTERSHYIAPVADNYLYDVRVRAVYSSGRTSQWIEVTDYLVIGKTAAPAAPASFSFASQRDYTREFSWTLNTTDPDVAGYKIRFSTTLTDEWEDMTALHTGLLVSSPWETNLLNAGTYRFGIKTVDTSGNESIVAKYMTATLEDSPVSSVLAAYYPRLEGWPGTITNGYVAPGSGDIEATDSTSWDDLETEAPSWDQWPGWGISGDDLVYQYTDIDLGVALTFRPVVSVQADGNVVYEIATSDDGVSWSAWTTPSGDITTRYLRVRVTVTGDSPRIQSMSILLDGDKDVEDLEDVDTSALTGDNRIAVGDVRLPITHPFTKIISVQVALQNTGPGWTWELIDKTVAVGPRIKIYNNTGTLADATVDATIKGY